MPLLGPRARRTPTSSSPRALIALWAVLAASCVEPERESTGTTSEPVIYGDDDRQDVYAFWEEDWAEQAAGFTAAMIPILNIDQTVPGDVLLHGSTLEERGVCPDERFADQLTAAWCSATLIAPDLVLTGGNCIHGGVCSQLGFVFDYTMVDQDTPHTITGGDVYTCKEVVVRRTDELDYAVVRLDREVAGRTPARVKRQRSGMPVGRRLVVNGYPTGLPLKIEDGARVREGRTGQLDYFVSNLDTFAGNTGAGVFDRRNRQLAGILVRGDADYVEDADAGCLRPNRCPNGGCVGEDSTYAFRAVDALCDAGAPAEGLCSCGDGTCDAQGGEDSVSCDIDCGSECGDGACNGDESPDDCVEDCGTCGNGVCDGSDSILNCCTDCGCPVGDVCLNEECRPDPYPGDTCELPTALPFVPVQNVQSANIYAHNDFQGSCVGGDGNDRVYQLEVEMDVELDAQVWGFDTGMYLRTACGDHDTELACNDDGYPPGTFGSRINMVVSPGTYYLVVDGFDRSARGTYELSVVYRRLCPDDDEDFACDHEEGCPQDPDKTEPGMCGCGFNETDRDHDSVPDCLDPCPEDVFDECDAAPDDDDGAADDSSADDSSGGEDDEGGCNASGDPGTAPGGTLVSLWLLGMGAFGLRRRPRTRQAR
jgi:MYXO-CTERM domain-containing protein